MRQLPESLAMKGYSKVSIGATAPLAEIAVIQAVALV